MLVGADLSHLNSTTSPVVNDPSLVLLTVGALYIILPLVASKAVDIILLYSKRVFEEVLIKV